MAKSNSLRLLDRRFDEFKALLSDELDVGDKFEIFCADIVLKDLNWAFDELETGITGGDKDGGMDAIHLLINGELINEASDFPDIASGIQIRLIIMQMKHAQATEEAVIDRLYQHIDEALSLEPDAKFHEKHFSKNVQSKLKLFREAMDKYGTKQYSLKIEMHYCSRGDAPEAGARSLAKKLESKCLQCFPGSVVSFDFFGADKLHSIAARPRLTTRTLQVDNGVISTQPGPSYLCLVALDDYVKFITDDDQLNQNLFEFNVRDFEGKGKSVNISIAETIKSPKSETEFWWLNNGITVVSDEVTQTNKTLTINNPMIVNGLQTSHVVFANRANIAEGDERSILVRVVQTSDPAIQEAVIKATNSQNSLTPLALRATEQRQKDIEEFLKNHGVFYERRKNYYKNRGKSSKTIVDLAKLAQSVMAIRIGIPEQSRARPGTYLKKEENYKKVFPPSTDYMQYVNAAKLERKVDAYFASRRKIIDPVHRNNLKFHTLMVLSWNMTNSQKPKLEKIDSNKATSAEIEKAFKWIKVHFDKSGAEDNTAKDRKFTSTLKTEWKPILN